MEQEYVNEIEITDELFDEARVNFNAALQMTMGRMIKTGAIRGSVALKIGIEMEHEEVDDFSGAVPAKREAIFPEFGYNVSTTITEKPYEEKGTIDPQLEIFYDLGDGKYRLKPQTGSAQISIFDYKDDVAEDGLEDDEDDEDDETGADIDPFDILISYIGEHVELVDERDDKKGVWLELDSDTFVELANAVPDIAAYVGRDVKLVAYDDGDMTMSIELECRDTGDVICSWDNPDKDI